jgi:hypothetical protein
MTFYLHVYHEQVSKIDATGKLPPYRQVAEIIAARSLSASARAAPHSHRVRARRDL